MTATVRAGRRPRLTDAGLPATETVTAVNERGEPFEREVATERPLTLYLDRHEIVTLMTLGTHPEALALGYLRNQALVGTLEDIESVQVDWEVSAAAVRTRGNPVDVRRRLERRTVTTGCGQGTVFGDILAEIENLRLPRPRLRQSVIYRLLRELNARNTVYAAAGAVHGCALCAGEQVLYFVEDVGRHNAADAIAGMMWLDGIDGGDKLFYTTGRLTSEMVIKCAQMGVPALLSRSGITFSGLEIARRTGVTLIARAHGRRFHIYHGAETVELDAPPPSHEAPGGDEGRAASAGAAGP